MASRVGKLNLEGLITISQGDLVATERILLRAIRFPDWGVKPHESCKCIANGTLRDALPPAEKAHKMEPEIGFFSLSTGFSSGR